MRGDNNAACMSKGQSVQGNFDFGFSSSLVIPVNDDSFALTCYRPGRITSSARKDPGLVDKCSLYSFSPV